MTKPAYKPKYILWVDLEMTGLDPMRDEILEVAAIVTDWDFNEIATYEGVVKHDPDHLQELLDGNKVFWDENAVARVGLEAQNDQGKSRQEVEADLLAFIETHFPGEEKVLLGGNSVHQDRKFIARWWPTLDTKLHYRMLDVSAWKVVFEGKYSFRFAKPEEHRALEDIRGSIMELKYYLSKVTTRS